MDLSENETVKQIYLLQLNEYRNGIKFIDLLESLRSKGFNVTSRILRENLLNLGFINKIAFHNGRHMISKQYEDCIRNIMSPYLKDPPPGVSNDVSSNIFSSNPVIAANERSNLISQFCKETSVDAVRAQHYLEASDWDYNLAVYNYFEEDKDSENAPDMFPRPGSPKLKLKHKLPSSGGTSDIFLELCYKASGREVHVKLEDRSNEECLHKKPEVQAFAGTAFRLGNVTPTVTSPPYEQSQKTNEDAQKSIGMDDSKPVTNLQIRLADGSRLFMKANHNHTVGAVRRFIVEARPEYASLLFSLLSSFPPKELVDDNATLEEENLINAVIVQKLKK